MRNLFLIFSFITTLNVEFFAQLPVGRDTLTVLENGYVQKMPWAGGLNFCEFSQIDLDGDGKKDIVAFDKISSTIKSIFRCFLNKGNVGETKYSFDASLATKFPPVYYWAFFYDYDTDGKADLLTYVTGGIRVYKNTSTPGNLSFQLLKNRLYSEYNPGGVPSPGNIPSSGVAVPGIADIDNDGDMDILTFSTTGVEIEYHINKSKELYGHSDSLVYELKDNCWGDISESSCQINLNQCPLKSLYEKALNENGKVYHAGSCIMCFDRDGDGDQDLTLGDISCPTLFYLENTGNSTNAHIGDTTVLYPNYPTPASQTIRMNNFPCTYHLDVDNDNKKDLIASPNMNGSENFNSVWLYKNVGTTVSDFQIVKKNFLQDEMIEVGEGSYPAFFDYDNDGLLDLLIGNAGYYMTNTIKSRLTYYKNVGTLSQPSYSLITRDFASISTSSISTRLRIVPTFGDIDTDGDTDMLLGDGNGFVHWYENTAGAGATCNFSNLKVNPFNVHTSSANAYPQLIDLNRDGLLDLIIGTLNGKLAYYKNVGTTTLPSFTLVTNALGGVNVNTDPANFLGDGSCAPFMYDVAGTYKLLCGSVNGHIFQYDNIDGNLTGNFALVDTSVNYIYEGTNSTVQFVDINGDGKRDLIAGNYCGGLGFYSSKNPIGIQEIENVEELVSVYPNPSKDILNIKFKNPDVQRSKAELVDLYGRTILSHENEGHYNFIDASSLARGVYLLKVNAISSNSSTQFCRKVIIN